MKRIDFFKNIYVLYKLVFFYICKFSYVWLFYYVNNKIKIIILSFLYF